MLTHRWIPLLLVPMLVTLAVSVYLLASRTGTIVTAAIWLDPNAALTVDIPAGASPRLYAFRANPASDTLVRLSTNSTDFAFAAEVRDSQGTLVAGVDGNRLLDARLTIGPGQSVYQVAVEAAEPRRPGKVVLALGTPVAPTPTPAPPICGIIAAGSAPIAVYDAPRPQAALIGQLPVAGLLIARGRLRGGWYTADVAGRSVWVPAASVRLQGTCGSLPVVLDPTIPSAPKDAEPHALYVDRDGSASLNGVVGAPLGDTLDTLWIAVLNLYDRPPANYREFALRLTCDGVGVENLRWGAPQSQTHRCGESLRLPFLFNLARQPIVVQIPAGSEQSYVSYTLSVASSGAD